METFPAPADISELFSAAANNSICAIGEIAV